MLPEHLLLSHGCSFDVTLDEVSLLLLVCNFSSSGYILYLSFQGIPYAGGQNRTTYIEGLPAVGPEMAEVLAVVALSKANLSSA
jgi:hypothetical protein